MYMSSSVEHTRANLQANSVYSAYEHSLLTSSTNPSASVSAEITPLPLDITIETIVSLLVLCTGVVLGAPSFRPIQWPVWAASVDKEDHLQLEQRRRLIEDRVAGSQGGGAIGNPFSTLEERPSFLDIRARRKEFADWIREGDAGGPVSKA